MNFILVKINICKHNLKDRDIVNKIKIDRHNILQFNQAFIKIYIQQSMNFNLIN